MLLHARDVFKREGNSPSGGVLLRGERCDDECLGRCQGAAGLDWMLRQNCVLLVARVGICTMRCLQRPAALGFEFSGWSCLSGGGKRSTCGLMS
jgi:hypothetical protein